MKFDVKGFSKGGKKLNVNVGFTIFCEKSKVNIKLAASKKCSLNQCHLLSIIFILVSYLKFIIGLSASSITEKLKTWPVSL